MYELHEQFRSDMLFVTVVRLTLAAILGGLIGLERGRSGQAAGMRTYMLVCLGAALVMLTNSFVSGGDSARMGAQVVSGIGFLGAGTILVDKGKQKVRGLTTAAGLWASACMGLAIGIGYYIGAIVSFLLISGIVTLMNRLERRLLADADASALEIVFPNLDNLNMFFDYIVNQRIIISDMQMSKTLKEESKEICVHIEVQLPRHITREKLYQTACQYGSIEQDGGSMLPW